MPRGHPVGQLGELGLGDDDGAGVEEVLRQGRVVGRHQADEGQRPAGGRHERGVDVVLQRDRDAVQRAADLAGRALAVEGVGLLQRLVVDGDDGVDGVLIHRDAGQVLRDDLARRGAPCPSSPPASRESWLPRPRRGHGALRRLAAPRASRRPSDRPGTRVAGFGSRALGLRSGRGRLCPRSVESSKSRLRSLLPPSLGGQAALAVLPSRSLTPAHPPHPFQRPSLL